MSQNKPYIVVITGGIATGKSQATKYIRSKGYTVLDSDFIVHEGYEKGSELYRRLICKFSSEILNFNGEIDRGKLGKIVLNNEDKLKTLNKIVHKYVVDKLMEGVEKTKDKLIFLDIPLIIEEKEALISMGLEFHQIWLIYIPVELQRMRLEKRAIEEGKNVEQALKIIEKQMPIDEKRNFVDRIIDNQGSIEELERNIDSAMDSLI